MNHNNIKKAGTEEVLAVMPARGGSTRIPRKNIRDLCGKPALAYTIEAAVQSGIFSRVIVSTDDEEIAAVAMRHGGEVPFIRPSALADDYTPVSLVTLDALERLDPDGTLFQSVAQMMPNCPLRTEVDMKNSYRQFVETDADSQISVTRYGWLNPWWAMMRDNRFRLAPVFEKQMDKRSQDLPELFCPTGTIWWAKAVTLRREKTYHIAGRTGWELPWYRAIDIDTEEDWKMAEFLIQAQKKGKHDYE
jgi:N-acylneuraminate cytidylyltransferase